MGRRRFHGFKSVPRGGDGKIRTRRADWCSLLNVRYKTATDNESMFSGECFVFPTLDGSPYSDWGWRVVLCERVSWVEYCNITSLLSLLVSCSLFTLWSRLMGILMA